MLQWIHNFFNNQALRRFWLTVRIPIGIAAFGVLLSFAKSEWFWIAFTTSMIGEFIQLWCFSSLDKKKTLAFNGPYKHVRNPMYIGRFLIVLGYALLLRSWPLIPLTVIVYGFYMVNRVKREEAVLVRVFGNDYHAYCDRIGRFFPSVTGMENSTLWYWKWRLFHQNHGTLNLLVSVLSYGVLYAWVVIRNV